MTIGEALERVVNDPEVSMYEIAEKLNLSQSELIFEIKKREPESVYHQAEISVGFVAGALWMSENVKSS